MAERSGFFNSIKQTDGTYDLTYDATDFADYFNKLISNGVFGDPAGQLRVVPKSGLTITVKAGRAYIGGYWYELTEDKDITIPANTETYTQLYAIVLFLDTGNRVITAIASMPLTSKPQTVDKQSQLWLATFNLPVGAIEITQAMITDRRPDKEYCGYVTGLINGVDYQGILDQQTAQFNEWFDGIKGQLSGDVATRLQAQIDALPVIRSGTADPNNSVGKDGDIYIKILNDTVG